MNSKPRRFFYHCHSTETGCSCVTQPALDKIALEVRGECIGNAVVQSDYRATRKQLRLLSDALKVEIECRDSVVIHAQWLLSIAHLANAFGEHEFSAFAR